MKKDDLIEKNKRNKEITLKMLDFIEKESEYYKNHNSSKNDFNFGIFYGLTLGILGNVLVSAFFEYFGNSIRNSLWIIIIVCLIVIMLFLFIIIKESKKYKKVDKELSNRLDQVSEDRDAIENGELEPNQFVTDQYIKHASLTT